MSTLYLVACSATKGKLPAPARDLYQGGCFKLARSWIEAIGAPWLILSARHGVVRPEERIAPYEQALLKAPAPWRLGWAKRVLVRLEEIPSYRSASHVVLLAGSVYAEYLVEGMERRGLQVSAPLARKGIGDQLGYLSGKVREVRP